MWVALVALLAAGVDVGAGPDDNEKLSPPSIYHGNWRVLAADDPAQDATMRIQILHSPGERDGNGSYVLYQPFCDLVAEQPITGSTQCELIDQGGELTINATQRNMTVSFYPTADGLEHRLIFRRKGKEMVGVYSVADYRRAIRLVRPPE